MQTTSTTQPLLKKFLYLLILISGYLNGNAQTTNQCYTGTNNPNVTAKQTWSVNQRAGTVTIRTTFSKNFVDNTYGINAVGWNRDHKFNDLVGSDHLQLSLYDANNSKQLEFKIDYISSSNSAPSGYATLGVMGGEGKMIIGNESDIIEVKTSIDSNLNGYGYQLTTNSPSTDANYSPNPQYSKWIFDVWYEVTVSLSAFPAGFGKAEIASVHASPSKTGNNSEDVTPGPCPPPGNPPIGCLTCVLGYPDNSNLPRSAQVFNESEVLRAYDPGPSICGQAPEYIKLWYNDEHALTLGVRRVIVKTAGGTTTTDYPITATPAAPACVDNPIVGTKALSGDQSGNDVAVGGGRPLWPALFITDLTVNGTNSRAGDWQYGGTAISPSRVCGTWKAAVRTVDKTRSPEVVTVTPDADPAKNNWNLAGGDAPPAGTENEGYGAVIYWKLSDLNLIPGHSYRLQFMVHDGDQNKSGGDVGQACTILNVPVPPASIGDYVWDDNGGGNLNNQQNGIQDAGEPGVPNITVTLYDANGNVKATTFTDANGKYMFNNVDISNGPTQYKVGFAPLPNKYTWTFKNRGNDAGKNSDVNQNSGITDLFTITPGQSRLDIDAGMFNPGGPTPVNITQFTGRYSNGISTLNWQVANQLNLSSYEIQRSTNASNYETIGTVKANNQSGYNFNDANPEIGVNYYRLRINDINGGYSLGNTIAINVPIRGITIRSVYPNPFGNQLQVSIASEKAEPVSIRILDNSGRIVKTQNLTTQKGLNEVIVKDLGALNSGIYIVEVKTPYTSVKSKVSK